LSLNADHTYAWIGVFTGSAVDQLTGVGSSFSAIGVAVTAGTTYQILVDTADGTYPFNVTLNFLPSIVGVPNDNFTNAALLTGASPSVFESNMGATKEPGEPNHGNNPGGQSVWFSWTSPSSGVAQIEVAAGANFYALLGVYQGTALTNLATLGESAYAYPTYSNPQVSVPVTNGMTLQIAVDGYNGFYDEFGAIGDFTLEVQLIPTPANDMFANRAQIVGTNATVSASNIAATSEPNEPALGISSSGHTVWWTWTARISRLPERASVIP
jgi:hypothetical protein